MGNVVRLTINEKAVEKFKGTEGMRGLVESAAANIANTANDMGAGFVTARFYDRDKQELKGGKTPIFATKGRMSRGAWVSLVYEENYAAIKHNYENNTLLKAMGAAHV